MDEIVIHDNFTTDDIGPNDHLMCEYVVLPSGEHKRVRTTLIKAADVHRELLPREHWTYCFEPPNEVRDYEFIIVGCFVKGTERCLSYELFKLSDLPNDFVSAVDLEAILSNVHDRSVMHSFETLPRNQNR